MQVQQLHLQAFRCFTDARIQLCPRFNVITGENGSGKTTLLEALHLLAHGRSFRGRVRDGLIQNQAPALQVFAECLIAGTSQRIGLRHSGQSWEGRVNGGAVQQLGQLCEVLAAVSFEPGSHALIDGASQLRRRYLDWGVFHVEHSFMPEWRRFARALKQRNVLLRQAGSARQLDSWEYELAQAGEQITQHRELYLEHLQQSVAALTAQLLPSAGEVVLSLNAGWKRESLGLADALLLARERDMALGYTSLGPHRADIRIQLRDLPECAHLSRGQTKQLALLLILAQAEHLAQVSGYWPVIQLDDLGSELDQNHQLRVLEVLQSSRAQVLITGTEPLAAVSKMSEPLAMFHVEHGGVQPWA